MIEECPKCKSKYPDAHTRSWSGGGDIVETHNRCNRCGTKYNITHNCKTKETVVTVIP